MVYVSQFVVECQHLAVQHMERTKKQRHEVKSEPRDQVIDVAQSPKRLLVQSARLWRRYFTHEVVPYDS